MTNTGSKSDKLENKPFVDSVLENHKQDIRSIPRSLNVNNYPNVLREGIKELFLELPEVQFLDLVRTRLKPANSEDSIQESIEDDREYWLPSYLVDRLHGEMSRTKITITASGKQIHIRKYYNRARKIFKFISIAKSDLEFVINISDLSPRLIAELKILDKMNADYVLKLAVGGIFENINSKLYQRLGFAKRLKVRLDR
jgi:hypothetical protein